MGSHRDEEASARTADLLTRGMDGSLSVRESIAIATLDAGRLLMEAGGSAKSVERIVEMVARGFGAERVDLRIGYASLSVTVGNGDGAVTRMRRVGNIGVNQRVIHELWDLARRVVPDQLSVDATRTELARVVEQTPRHRGWVIAAAVGLACAAFGRLLGVDWYGTASVFLAATGGQFIRHRLLVSRVNVFLSTALVSFLTSLFAGLGARWVGSATYTAAMIASILLLVPGVPAFNAQSDILEGYPTLGSARAVTVAMILVFIAAGLWLGHATLNQWHSA